MEEKNNKLNNKEDHKKYTEIFYNNYPVLFITIGFILIFVTAYFYYTLGTNTEYTAERRGQIGDFFGGILNPIFAFLSFCLFLVTIKIQSKSLKNSQEELELTREELKETRKATRDSADALKEQSNSIKLQNFETTFFNMISLHNEIINNLKIENHYLEYEYLESNVKKEIRMDSGSVIKKTVINTTFNKVKTISISGAISEKRESIKDICTNIDNFIKNRNYGNKYINSDIYKINSLNNNRKPTLLYDLCHHTYSDLIGHYFGNIYQILKHISTSKDIKDMEDKRKYSDLFRAQFSAQELKLLFYHCSGSIGSTRFKPLIEEFEFLEHLSIEENNTFFEYILYKSIYQNTAFGIKNIQNIEHVKSRIIDKINTKIERIKEEEKYKYLDMYKYFSEEDLKSCLLKAQENPKSFTNPVSINLLLLDYTEDNKPKRYLFREE